ncbi:hypothetical protein NAEGRDRAFT_49599 [Naegleria gruberi]|uniref:SprT-like domain-containing protein n=1 Tax=Naegleria gruberi TaxID=5762 RepID=D2VHK3_NAEGR|nr:uncharacterized protein NAEGRDRAFT_49599 [Naegleria gruberi]EFC43604.1 hypothetical protein NAEGRDRAFT_49599 [Naegleria gruberi]|eukprot:XP_002676348.1 hypothetical protein NAEGRDRAFT_49599 [Naegleria gruberi strain NEG-M]
MPPTNIRTLSSSNNNSSPSSSSGTQKSFPTTGGRTLRVSSSSSSTNEDNSTDRIGASSSSSTDVKKAPLNNNNSIIIKRDDGMENIPREFTPQKFIPPPRFDTNKTRSNPSSSSSNNSSNRQHVCSSLCSCPKTSSSNGKKNSCDTPIFNQQTVNNFSDAIILAELNSPTPDVHVLFTHFDGKYFRNKLSTCTTLRWSSKMTLCAGICYSQYQKYTITKTFGPRVSSSGYYDPNDILKKQEQVTQKICTISLSECLLKFRPPIDTISTLIHEMIHAFLFIDSNVVDREGHGENFQWWMKFVNTKENGTGIHITIYHTFHAEVDYYRQHHWRCKKCAMLVKRAMNRAPNKHDDWFADHEKKCGGSFVKIKEPEKVEKKKSGNYKGIEKSRKFMENFLTKKNPTIKGIESDSDLTKVAANQISNSSTDKKNEKKPINDLIIIEEDRPKGNTNKKKDNLPITIEILDDEDEEVDSPSYKSDEIFINDDDYIPPDNVIILTNDQDIQDDVIIL